MKQGQRWVQRGRIWVVAAAVMLLAACVAMDPSEERTRTGDPKAQYRLGDQFYYGNGRPKSYRAVVY